MLNSMAAGRRQALQVVSAQAGITVVLALAFLVQGVDSAVAVLVGGLATAAGSALLAWRAFAGGVGGPAVALFRLFGGIALKWLVIVTVLYLGMARFGLPPLPLVVGLSAALVASLLAFRIKS